MRLQVVDEVLPVLTNFPEELCENLNRLVLMHLLVQHAEVLVVLGGLPALIVMAAVDLGLLGLVLSEVEAFSWEHLASDRRLEILVRYQTISIQVETAKNVLKLVFSDVIHSPEV